MTLIELLAAMAIAGFVAAATLGVVGGMSRRAAGEKSAGEASLLRDRLRKALRADIIHAVRYRNEASGLRLRTRASLDGRTLRLEHIPTQVAYEVRKTHSGPVLLRRQMDADGSGFAELVCVGAEAISLRPAGSGIPLRSSDWKALPRSVVVRVEFRDERQEACELVFHVE
jgi:type II secretory pathway pseudopilin PulG